MLVEDVSSLFKLTKRDSVSDAVIGDGVETDGGDELSSSCRFNGMFSSN